MKKIFTLFVALFSIATLFAQSARYDQRQWNDSRVYNSRNSDQNGGRYDNFVNGQDGGQKYNGYYNQGYNDRNSYDRNYSNDRREESVQNKEYNRDYNDNSRIFNERKGHSYNYGHEVYGNGYSQRSEKLNAVGAGLIVGGIIALLAGSR